MAVSLDTIMKDEQKIRNLVKKWMESTKEGDTETVLSLMTDDVVFLVAGQKPFGKEVFAQAATQMKSGQQSAVRFEGSSDIEEIKILGDWAFARAKLKVSTVPINGGEITHRSGYTLSIFQKGQDGEWRLSRDANLLTVDK